MRGLTKSPAPHVILHLFIQMLCLLWHTPLSEAATTILSIDNLLNRRFRNGGGDSTQRAAHRDRTSGITLGDIEAMETSSAAAEGNFSGSIGVDGGITPPNDVAGDGGRNGVIPADSADHGRDHLVANLRRGLGKVHLDLSGRVLCHLISPPLRCHSRGVAVGRTRGQGESEAEVASREALVAADEAVLSEEALDSAPLFTVVDGGDRRRWNGLLPFVPRVYAGANYDFDEIWYGATRFVGKLSWGPCGENELERLNSSSKSKDGQRVPRFRRMRQIIQRSMLDVEAARSVFDRRDSRIKITLAGPSPAWIEHSYDDQSSKENQRMAPQLSLNLDSGNVLEDGASIAPILTMNVRAPVHKRVELSSKSILVLGQRGVNCSPEVATTISREKRRLGGMVPAWRPMWLENDCWIPRVTLGTLGKLASTSEYGFRQPYQVESQDGSSLGKLGVRRRAPFLCSKMGIKLRISRKLDWSSWGIPWDGGTTRVRLDICGVNGAGDRYTAVGFDAEPNRLVDSIKIVLGQEQVIALQ